jgi:hypothetical protein
LALLEDDSGMVRPIDAALEELRQNNDPEVMR